MHSDLCFIDEQRNADYVDAMADLSEEQWQAMHESNSEEWIGYEPELSKAEVNACDHYNERYIYPTSD